MGYVSLDGQLLHTSMLNPNPVIIIETVKTETKGNVTYVTQNYIYRDGKKETVILSYTTCNS